MQLLSNTKIDFVARHDLAARLSIAVLVIALLAIFIRGLSFGIDFTGGTLIEVGFQSAPDLSELRNNLAENGYGDAVVQRFGDEKDVLIRIAPREGVEEATLSNAVVEVLKAAPGGADLDVRRVEFVGPQVGEELREDGGLAMLIALFAIFLYVMLRFEWKFSVGAVAALFHDVIIVIGAFALLGMSFDLTVLAAVLAVIGYSLNDTIVVFDRIRENFRKMRRGTSADIVNSSLNQTLARTVMTSVTTLLVLLALFFVGGELIHNFSIALLIGVLVGTYSSIFVASNFLLKLGISKADLMQTAKEDPELEARP